MLCILLKDTIFYMILYWFTQTIQSSAPAPKILPNLEQNAARQTSESCDIWGSTTSPTQHRSDLHIARLRR